VDQPLLLRLNLAPKISLSRSHFEDNSSPFSGAKTSLSWSHFEDDPSPYISWSSSDSLIRILHTFVLFKNITLTWINYLETWLSSDNTLVIIHLQGVLAGSWCSTRKVKSCNVCQSWLRKPAGAAFWIGQSTIKVVLLAKVFKRAKGQHSLCSKTDLRLGLRMSAFLS